MRSQAFEIKVALLGHVSVGKTTLLNALFQGKFGEVSKKRTTAGINHFRISSESKAPKKSRDEEKDDAVELDSSIGSKNSFMAADETLAQITDDNRLLREKNDIQEKVFDIHLDEHLVEMRDDTRLVLVDIPGINEAHTSKLYLDFVEKKWNDFDCVVIVMDANTGVNTEEQVKLLQLVNEHAKNIKDIPVIVLCNKVDDPDDEEIMALVAEVQREVEKIFCVEDRQEVLKKVLDGRCSLPDAQIGPVFIPMSAENAFLYRAASQLQPDEYNRLDKVYLEKIGHEEVGKFKWKKLSDEEKYKIVFNVVSDPAQYQERMEASNFDKVLKVLGFFLGGKKKQEDIIQKQLEIVLNKLSVDDDITGNLCKVYEGSAALGKCTKHLEPKFWSLYEEHKKRAFNQLSNNAAGVSSLHVPMSELIEYASTLHKKLHSTSSHEALQEGQTRIIDAMKELIRAQIGLVLEKESVWEPAASCTWHRKSSGKGNNPATRPKVDWNTGLTYRDWSTIFTSLLLQARRKPFYENFGKEIADVEWCSRAGRFLKLYFFKNATCCCKSPTLSTAKSSGDAAAPVPNTFGQTANETLKSSRFGAITTTLAVPYQVTSLSDGCAMINLQAITAMDAYKNKCFEELRLEDYNMGNKGSQGQHPAAGAPVGGFGGFGALTSFRGTTPSASRFSFASAPFVSAHPPNASTAPTPFGSAAKGRPNLSESASSFQGLAAPQIPASNPFDAPAASSLKTTPVFEQPDYKKILTEFFQKHNKEKVGQVGGILSKYRGRETKMFEALAKKYCTSNPLTGATSSSASSPHVAPCSTGRFKLASSPSFSPQANRPPVLGWEGTNISFDPDKWRCATCTLSNKASAPKCAACDEAKPGREGETMSVGKRKTEGGTSETSTGQDVLAASSEDANSSTSIIGPGGFTFGGCASTSGASSFGTSSMSMSSQQKEKWAQAGVPLFEIGSAPSAAPSLSTSASRRRGTTRRKKRSAPPAAPDDSVCADESISSVQMEIPSSLADHSHWGHLSWMFCEFMDTLASV